MPFLTAQLSRLILLNYEVNPSLLAPRLPTYTELDFYDHRAFVSLIGLHFSKPRIYGLPLPFYREYAQVNLRFYVRRRIERGNWRRGVVFIGQIVPHLPVAWAARSLFHENAVARNMDEANLSQSRNAMTTEYGWRSGGQRYFIRAVYPDHPVLPEPGTVEEFLLERYWGYTRQQDGGCLEYRFSHPPWRICKAVEAETSPGLGDFYGPPFAGLFGKQPNSAFAANGSEVVLSRGHPC
ncbi:MAG: DUF2071 domain-containing protein [Desulfurivibrionaceae bacterium]